MEGETRVCANCKRSINAATFELHESHCVRHIKLCEICEEPIPVKDLDAHFRENHAPVPCDLCGVEVPSDQLEDHKEHSCEQVKIECKYCELDICRVDYAEHVEHCGSRTDFCELCNQRVMLKDMNEHQAMKCGHMKAESPLRPADLHGMGLTNQESSSDSDDEDVYLPQNGNGYGSVTPPPSYERRHDDSMHVDPYWLQTVAEACGEDNLDTLLAQNVFYENMRSLRSGDHHVTNELGSHDDHVTTEEQHLNEGATGGSNSVRDEPASDVQEPVDNRLVENEVMREREFEREVVADEDEDYRLAQRIQEREVMGHSRTLFEEQQVRETTERDEEDEITMEVEEDVQEEVKSKVTDDEYLAMVLKKEELDKKMKKAREENERLAKKIEQVKEERDSLKLATELQKQDIAESRRRLWKKTSRSTESSHSYSSQADDERVVHKPRSYDDRRGHTHVDDDEPHPPAEEDPAETIPCQWCNRPIPFEQVMLHQQSCYEDYFRGEAPPTEYNCGPHFTEDTLRRVESEETDNLQVDDFAVECQYCQNQVSIRSLSTHEALCDFNPDINLKKAYDSKMSSARTQPRVDHTHPRLPSPSNAAVSSGASNKLLSVEKGPCEYCQKVVPLSELIKHEATCRFYPRQHSPDAPPSSPTTMIKYANEDKATPTRRGLAIKFPEGDRVQHENSSERFQMSTTTPSTYETGELSSPTWTYTSGSSQSSHDVPPTEHSSSLRMWHGGSLEATSGDPTRDVPATAIKRQTFSGSSVSDNHRGNSLSFNETEKDSAVTHQLGALKLTNSQTDSISSSRPAASSKPVVKLAATGKSSSVARTKSAAVSNSSTSAYSSRSKHQGGSLETTPTGGRYSLRSSTTTSSSQIRPAARYASSSSKPRSTAQHSSRSVLINLDSHSKPTNAHSGSRSTSAASSLRPKPARSKPARFS